MEKTLKSNNDKEFMRMAMLKHEETFREQVNELHRLYRIQKMLMESVELKQHHQQKQQQQQKFEHFTMVESSKKPFTVDHFQQQQQAQQRDIISTNINGKSRINGNNIIMGSNLIRPDNNTNQVLLSGNQAQEHIAESNGNDNKLRKLDEAEIELTLSLGPSSNNNNPTRRRKPGDSESGQSISSSSTGSSQTRKTSPKDNNNIISMSTTTTWGGFLHQGSGIEPGFSNGQQNSNPPWLYQALSLKLT